MVWKPHVTVAAVLEKEGRFLMVSERVDGSAVINQPAGHLEDGESLADAAVRETLEETAWLFRPTAITGIYQWRHPGEGKTFLRFGFCGDILHHDPDAALDPDIDAALWLSPDELKSHATPMRSPMVMRCIDDYLAGNRWSLELLYDVE